MYIFPPEYTFKTFGDLQGYSDAEVFNEIKKDRAMFLCVRDRTLDFSKTALIKNKHVVAYIDPKFYKELGIKLLAEINSSKLLYYNGEYSAGCGELVTANWLLNYLDKRPYNRSSAILFKEAIVKHQNELNETKIQKEEDRIR